MQFLLVLCVMFAPLFHALPTPEADTECQNVRHLLDPMVQFLTPSRNTSPAELQLRWATHKHAA